MHIYGKGKLRPCEVFRVPHGYLKWYIPLLPGFQTRAFLDGTDCNERLEFLRSRRFASQPSFAGGKGCSQQLSANTRRQVAGNRLGCGRTGIGSRYARGPRFSSQSETETPLHLMWHFAAPGPRQALPLQDRGPCAIWQSTTPVRGRTGRTPRPVRQSRPLTRGCVPGWGLPPSRRYRWPGTSSCHRRVTAT